MSAPGEPASSEPPSSPPRAVVAVEDAPASSDPEPPATRIVTWTRTMGPAIRAMTQTRRALLATQTRLGTFETSFSLRLYARMRRQLREWVIARVADASSQHDYDLDSLAIRLNQGLYDAGLGPYEIVCDECPYDALSSGSLVRLAVGTPSGAPPNWIAVVVGLRIDSVDEDDAVYVFELGRDGVIRLRHSFERTRLRSRFDGHGEVDLQFVQRDGGLRMIVAGMHRPFAGTSLPMEFWQMRVDDAGDHVEQPFYTDSTYIEQRAAPLQTPNDGVVIHASDRHCDRTARFEWLGGVLVQSTREQHCAPRVE